MKILIVNSSDTKGGAARAAYRLSASLASIGVSCELLVNIKNTNHKNIIGSKGKLKKITAKFLHALDYLPITKYFIQRYLKDRNLTMFTPAWQPFGNIIKKINQLKPDLVHLHWIGDGMIRLEDLIKVKAPIVWTMHDMWAFTGGCHYNEWCERFLLQCGQCKVLGSKKFKDISYKNYKRKKEVYSKINLTIVSPSNWLANEMKKSSLLKDKKVVVIPNAIDTNVFQPLSKLETREKLKLPINKKLVLCGAQHIFNDPRKGINELTKALNFLENDEIEFVLFGNYQESLNKFKLKTHLVGEISSESILVELYSAVDVMVVPSLQENLSNIIMESLSCGTPVVGFNIGGNSDMIEHRKNGYLALPLDCIDLANGINWVLNNANNEQLDKHARQKVVSSFSYPIIAKKINNLYQSLL